MLASQPYGLEDGDGTHLSAFAKQWKAVLWNEDEHKEGGEYGPHDWIQMRW